MCGSGRKNKSTNSVSRKNRSGRRFALSLDHNSNASLPLLMPLPPGGPTAAAFAAAVDDLASYLDAEATAAAASARARGTKRAPRARARVGMDGGPGGEVVAAACR